jgi:tRNA(Ile)-lysidine synthase
MTSSATKHRPRLALPEGLIGVACSGGADSMALADLAIDTAGADRVAVLTIDHGLSEGSARVAAGVAAWARGRGARAVVRRVDVARRASIEAAAREARYAALEELADELGLAVVLVGHTARDQAETVLMRIVRGTGPAGLAGIPARRGRFLRPLLDVDHERIAAYVAERGLPVWDDPMNVDPAIARVRVRRDILPALARENPQLPAALVRLAHSAAEWLEVIDARAAPLARLPIDCAALAAEPAAIRKRAVAIALEAAGIDHEAVHLEAIDRLVTAPRHGEQSVDLPAARVVRSYDRLDLAGAPPSLVPIAPPPGSYVVRTWRAGDRMRPARLGGRSRKLSDLYGDAKVPRSRRAAARVIVRTTDQVIVWAEHVGLAHASQLATDEAEAITSALPPDQTAGSF